MDQIAKQVLNPEESLESERTEKLADDRKTVALKILSEKNCDVQLLQDAH